MRRYPAITEFMTKNTIQPVGCFELYHPEAPIEYIMFLENKEIFDELEKSNFVAANLL